MKPEKYRILFLIFFNLACLNYSFSKSKETKDDFLYGSVVKSRSWEIDRGNNLEKFSGDVCFRNKDYKMSSYYAVYNHKLKIWNIKGNVYCLRNFENNLKIEAFCDLANYLELSRKAYLFSDPEKYIKLIYYGENNRVIKCLSKKIIADEISQIIEFIDEFSVYTDSAVIKGEKGVYDHKSQEFIITGKRLMLNAYQPDYETYIEGSYIKLNKNTMEVSVYENVRGVIIAKDWKNKVKLNEINSKRNY